MSRTQFSDGSAIKQDGHDLRASANAVKTDVAHLAHESLEAAKDKLAGAKEAARDALSAAKEMSTDAAESLKGVVVRHPAASIGIAVGVGLLLGMVLARPRH